MMSNDIPSIASIKFNRYNLHPIPYNQSEIFILKYQ